MAKVSLNANAVQKKLMDNITDLINDVGCGFLYGPEYEGRIDIQRHHVVGKSYKQNKTPIGHEFVIPVPFELHDPNMQHKFHVGHCKKAFVAEFGTQRSIYGKLIEKMREHCYEVPSLSILNAIESTSA
jgi:hypothetical protein